MVGKIRAKTKQIWVWKQIILEDKVWAKKDSFQGRRLTKKRETNKEYSESYEGEEKTSKNYCGSYEGEDK